MADLIKAAQELIDSIHNDVVGTNGRGGNGGIVSVETMKKTDKVRVAIWAAEREKNAQKQPNIPA
jgi:hypothetical protein